MEYEGKYKKYKKKYINMRGGINFEQYIIVFATKNDDGSGVIKITDNNITFINDTHSYNKYTIAPENSIKEQMFLFINKNPNVSLNILNNEIKSQLSAICQKNYDVLLNDTKKVEDDKLVLIMKIETHHKDKYKYIIYTCNFSNDKYEQTEVTGNEQVKNFFYDYLENKQTVNFDVNNTKSVLVKNIQGLQDGNNLKFNYKSNKFEQQ